MTTENKSFERGIVAKNIRTISKGMEIFGVIGFGKKDIQRQIDQMSALADYERVEFNQ